MKNSPSLRDVVFLLVGLAIACTVLVFILSDYTKTRAMEAQEQAVLEKRSDPSKDFKSLDNYITY